MLETIVVFQKFAALNFFTFLVIVWANNSMENRRNLAKQKIVHSLIFYISVFSLRNDWWLPRNWKSMIHSAIEVHESSKVDLKKLVVKMSLLMTSVENKPFCAKLSHSLIASTSIPRRNLYWMDGIWTYDALPSKCDTKEGPWEGMLVGCHHSSVDSSAPSILPPQVRVPSTPSMLSSIYRIALYGKNGFF